MEPSHGSEQARVADTTVVRIEPEHSDGYRRLRLTVGEQHQPRTELLRWAGSDVVDPPKNLRRLGGLIHFTDFQIADLASPSRVEFLQRRIGAKDWARMLPAYRPEEFLLPHAIEMTVRTVADLHAQDPLKYAAVLTTGDNTDSMQRNELSWFLTYMNGGSIDTCAGSNRFTDAPVGQGDKHYWNPEPGDDAYKKRGFPTQTGALAAAAQPVPGQGLGMPWLTCLGNHDCLIQGRVPAPSGYDQFLAGGRKPVATGSEPGGEKLDRYLDDPWWVADGEAIDIQPNAQRTVYSTMDYVRAHLESAGEPKGHGFTEENLQDETAYYVWDGIPGVRLIVLHTTNTAGYVDGCVDPDQFAWLEKKLQEVSTEWVLPNGDLTTHEPEQPRAVVIASHHGLSTMHNDFGDEPVYLAHDVRALLHRYPSVVLWLSGHTHINLITPRPATQTAEAAKLAAASIAPPTVAGRYDGRDETFPVAHASGGFWEVSTGAISEWPVQFRTVDIAVDCEESAVCVTTTMVDSRVAVGPDGSNTLEDLASLHREVAANDDQSVGGLNAHGAPADRNQQLYAPIPHSLVSRLRRVSE
jgi:metallophosphoesterase (TIGR03767 family)